MAEIFSVFYERDFDMVAAERSGRLLADIAAADGEYIARVDREAFVSHLVSKYAFDPLVLRFDDKTISHDEIDVPAENFPQTFAVTRGKCYRRPVVRYHIPFEGDPTLLRCKPNPSYMDTLRVFAHEGCLCFDIVVFYQNEPERIKNAAGQSINLIQQQYQTLSKQVDAFNTGLPYSAAGAIERRVAELNNQSAFMGALGVPVRKRDAPTLPVPVVRKRIVISRPAPPKASPEPALDQAMYEEILGLLHGLGRTFERLPSLYTGKDEEALRDHLIPYLESHFEVASTTGETFNKSGKTDILMRYEGKNVFVAECKFWGGQKKHFETIDQALSYLAWRDSKAAIICFVKNKAMNGRGRLRKGLCPSRASSIAMSGGKFATAES